MTTERLPKLLAIDDDPFWLEQVPLIFDEECEVISCSSIDQGLIALNTQFFDIILLDLNFSGDIRTGLDVFKQIAATDSAADVIVISGETKPDRLIQIMNAGVTQFIPKPSSPEQIRKAVRDTLRKREMRFHALNQATQGPGASPLIGSSPLMLRLKEEVAFVVQSGTKDILLIGETGTGKEVVARTIAATADPAKRLVPIHCGAISDGLAESELFGHVKGAFTGADRDRASAFEIIGGGFIFLDEIGDMPLHQQAKLLRVLQERKIQRVGSIEERPVSFRSISATNINLQSAIEAKRFREDLYYRIAKVQIRIPTLRERAEDIPQLIHYFIQKIHKNIEITDEAVTLLQTYSWPGNVRQLEAVIDVLASRCTDRVIRERDVCQAVPELATSFAARSGRPFLGKTGAALVSTERKRFQKALIDANGDRTKAATLLNISRATFFRRAKDLGLVKAKDQWMPLFR
jgi:two-component system response regulator AtoC